MKENSKTIVGRKLAELMEAFPHLGTQRAVGQKTGIASSTIGRIRRGEVNATLENVAAIASAFGVPVSFLYDETDVRGLSREERDAWFAKMKNGPVPESSNVETGPDISGRIPLVTWAQARNWDAQGGIDQANVEEWIQWPAVHGPNTFALRIVGESNFDPAGEKSYAPGDIIAVDPNRRPNNRNMVVVHLDGDDNASLRQILMDGESTRMLRLLNPTWPNRLTQMPSNARIVGVVIGKYVPE